MINSELTDIKTHRNTARNIGFAPTSFRDLKVSPEPIRKRVNVSAVLATLTIYGDMTWTDGI